MPGNDKSSSRNFGEGSKFTNWVLDSGSTFHMKPQVWGFILGSLEDMDKYIEVTGVHHVTVNQKG